MFVVRYVLYLVLLCLLVYQRNEAKKGDLERFINKTALVVANIAAILVCWVIQTVLDVISNQSIIINIIQLVEWSALLIFEAYMLWVAIKEK